MIPKPMGRGSRLAAAVAVLDRPALRWVAALCLAGGATTLSLVWSDARPTWVLIGYVAGICALLPLSFGVSTLAGFLILHGLLTWISHVKRGLTGLPLTILDLKIALANPAGLWDALSLPHWTRYLTTTAVVLAVLGWLATGLLAAARVLVLARRPARGAIVDAVARVAAVCIFGALTVAHFQGLFAEASHDRSTWHPRGVARLASRMGVLPFVAYSQLLESRATGDIFRDGAGASPPSEEEIREAVREHVDFAPEGVPASETPNIVVVLAESTFDPGAVFRLQGEWDDGLFRRDELTAAAGALRVNAVGGGTWITEFETIVGLDARMFGYSGWYTHASLSPFVSRSFATYLRDRGYRTWAFFPHGGEFYNGRRAYERYGFERILDREELGLKRFWEETDVRIAEKVRTALGPAPDSPFFAYLLFIENHAPHTCDATEAAGFPVRFADTLDFAPNCALHEYLRRLGSSTSAVRSLTAYLKDLEARTGRPFVLLVFGDHQPHTFTGTSEITYDYGPLRSVADEHVTFFHILSSLRGRRLQCCSPPPPASMLPTLLSGFVAVEPDDVYLGVNLWLFDRCGTDAVGRDFDERMGALESGSLGIRAGACRSAYERALAWYRTSGVVRLR